MAQWDRFYKELESDKPLWKKWFAWKRVEVNGEKVWFKTIYRRYHDIEISWPRSNRTDQAALVKDAYWEYGTILDVLKD